MTAVQVMKMLVRNFRGNFIKRLPTAGIVTIYWLLLSFYLKQFFSMWKVEKQ